MVSGCRAARHLRRHVRPDPLSGTCAWPRSSPRRSKLRRSALHAERHAAAPRRATGRRRGTAWRWCGSRSRATRASRSTTARCGAPGPRLHLRHADRAARRARRDRPLCLLLGADAFLELATWHRWARIVRPRAHRRRPPSRLSARTMQASHAGAARAQVPQRARAAPLRGRISRRPADRRGSITALDISATFVREHAGAGRQPALSAARRGSRLYSTAIDLIQGMRCTLKP